RRSRRRRRARAGRAAPGSPWRARSGGWSRRPWPRARRRCRDPPRAIWRRGARRSGSARWSRPRCRRIFERSGTQKRLILQKCIVTIGTGRRTVLGVKTSLYAITALIGLIADAGAADPAPCKLVPIDEWKVRADAPSPIVDGLINGQKIDVLLDTGMTLREGALLERAAARRLGIPITRNLSRTAAGIGGEAALSMAVIDEFRIGGAKRHAWDVIVGGADHGHKGT